jgi:predicted permease
LAEVSLDGRCVLFALVAASCAVLLGGTIPLRRLRRGTLLLNRSTRGGTAGRAANRTRQTLVAAQIALGLVALAGSGLLVRSFLRVSAVRPGFDADQVATYWMSLPPGRYAKDTAIVRFYSTLFDRARAVPGVVSVGLTSRLPLVQRGFNDNPFYVEGALSTDEKLPPLQLFTTVGGEYFQTMRIPLMAGKYFDAMDQQREGDAIISSRTASMFWHDSSGRLVIGKRFRVLPTSRWYTVVGVVASVRDSSLMKSPAPVVYFPQTEYTDPAQRQTARTMALVIRTRSDPSSLNSEVQRIVRALDPSLPLFDVQPMATAVRASTARLRFTALVLGTAALVTLMLGALGLYGVMGYVVALRRREIGIRIALGAAPSTVAAATTRDALRVTSIGLAVGLGLFAAAAPFARAALFGVAAWDPVAITCAVLILLVAAMLASWLPARRAAQVDPAEALRTEA